MYNFRDVQMFMNPYKFKEYWINRMYMLIFILFIINKIKHV